MRKIFVPVVILLMTMGSCKKYLDVNSPNPNSPTTSTPELVLGQSMSRTASNLIQFNNYGGWMVGYQANAGGYGGWGAALTYNYGTSDYTGLWGTYDILTDLQWVLDKTNGSDPYSYYNAIARILKVFNYKLMVDEYDAIPYFDALKGSGNTTPAYTPAADIYKDLYKEIDAAIATIRNAVQPVSLTYNLGKADPMFNGDMTKWLQFANTMKLKLLVRASKTNIFSGVTPTFDAAGFLTTDAMVNPGYGKVDGQQNPHWSSYHSSVTGGGAARSIIATFYVSTFYNGIKISDSARRRAIYRPLSATDYDPVRNQQGEVGPIVDGRLAPTGSSVWYSGNGSSYAFTDDPSNAIGILKGRGQSQLVLTAAESYFLQAEARMKGIITTGTVTDLFNKGIEASFKYLYTAADGTYKPNSYITGSATANPDPVAAAAKYKSESNSLTNNATNYLVNIDLATTDEQRLEAIITQKYIALNNIHGQEAWDEYKRTGYPKIDNAGLDQNKTFVSKASQATTTDKTIGRIWYPSTEYSLNPKNAPTNISVFGSFVFYDRRK
ncbi:MAG: SusD/RagB family nutrient-binding outer membrane lipoprotein [Citrobacter freundii]|nr:MAG: SusD/RagB family nutrient-binding outer membrane lipoprotein [Citrobacter freundii]